MKRIALVIYPNYCLFEITSLLEALRIGHAEVEVFAETIELYRSEEGILIQADKNLSQLNAEDFDGIILSGFAGEVYPIQDDSLLLTLIQDFNQRKKVIGAISIAPLFLLKSDVLGRRPFMCGCMKEDLLEEGFTSDQLSEMRDWKYCTEHYDLKFIRSEHILTSVAYGYREFAIEYCKMLGIDEIYPKTFGLVDSPLD